MKTRPDFIIFGHSKSGTTALHDMLDQHPDIYMSDPKEPNFFASDFTRKGLQYAFREMTPDEYRAIFKDAPGNAVCGESSASNIYSTVAAENAYRWNPDAKIIVIFREPVDFLKSYHMQMLKNPIEDGDNVEDLQTALDLEPQRKQGKQLPRGQKVPELLYYMERCKYTDQLKRLYSVFPREQVLVLLYDEFRKDNFATLKQVCSFLGVDPEFGFQKNDANVTLRVKNKSAQDLLHNLGAGRGIFSYIKPVVKSAVPKGTRDKLLSWASDTFVYSYKKDISAELERKLKQQFRPEVEEFGQLIGRDLLAHWEYDSIQ